MAFAVADEVMQSIRSTLVFGLLVLKGGEHMSWQFSDVTGTGFPCTHPVSITGAHWAIEL